MVLIIFSIINGVSAQSSRLQKRQADSLVLLKRQYDSLQKVQQEHQLERELAQNEKNLAAFLEQQNEKEEGYQQSLYLKSGAGLLILGLITYRFARKKKGHFGL